jgi:cyclic pyranopterin phosphate synthase
MNSSIKYMRDKHGRTINYLRLSITDRCNLRCSYCMPAEGETLCSHAEILSYEELLRIAEAAVELGVEKVRVTGGEPLVRKDVLGFLDQLGSIPGLKEMTLTTNGLLLEEQADQLRAVGVDRLNVSLDSLDPRVYTQVTRGGDLDKVLAGLEAAERAGLGLKLNMVVMRGINDHEVEAFAAMSQERSWSIRFIEYMPTIREKAWSDRVIPGRAILERLNQTFVLSPIATSRLSGPARNYRIAGAIGTIGIITPISDHFCGGCNRIRVTAQGFVKSCLLSDQALDLKPALAQGTNAVRKALIDVVSSKGDQHHFMDGEQSFQMSSIGG